MSRPQSVYTHVYFFAWQINSAAAAGEKSP